MKTEELFAYDLARGSTLIAGMDEAGRGPLAGPVVAACVIMPLDSPIDGINDSKKLSEKKRESLYEVIISRAVAYGVGISDNNEIDEINILNATKKAMREAYAAMTRKPTLLLVDAVTGLGLDCTIDPIVKGDATSYNIAAASIIAKVTRDRLVRQYDELYPEYGFAKNKGYGTKTHIEALRRIGGCPIHRKSFIDKILDENEQTTIF